MHANHRPSRILNEIHLASQPGDYSLWAYGQTLAAARTKRSETSHDLICRAADPSPLIAAKLHCPPSSNSTPTTSLPVSELLLEYIGQPKIATFLVRLTQQVY